jgi:K+-sensing histidine kinase KdpD
MRRYLDRDRLALIAAVLAPLAVTAMLVPFRASFSNTNSALILVVVVVAVAIIGNRVAGALRRLLGRGVVHVLPGSAVRRVRDRKAADVTTAVLLLVVGLAVSQLAARARRLKVVAITDAHYLGQIHDTARLAQSGASANAVATKVREQLVDLLQLRGCRFEYGTLLGHPPRSSRTGASPRATPTGTSSARACRSRRSSFAPRGEAFSMDGSS